MTVKVHNAKFIYSVPQLSMMRELGPEVAFIGRSNAGKSTLLNTLCDRKDLARTSKTPGRTRHAVVYQADFVEDDKTKPFCLVDLPGFGFAAMSKEDAKMSEKIIFSYLENRDNLALVIVLLDIRRLPDEREMQIINAARLRNIEVMVVITKCDKLPLAKRKPAKIKIAKVLGVAANTLYLHSNQGEEYRSGLRKLLFEKF